MIRHDDSTIPPEPTPEVLEQAMRRAHRMRSQAMWDVGAFFAGAIRRGVRRLAGARPLLRRPAP